MHQSKRVVAIPSHYRALLDQRLIRDLSDGEQLPVGSGWSEILLGLLERLAALDASAPGTVRIVQIKEKFGQLRVYLASSHPEATALIDEASRASAFICEACGKPSTIRNVQGWFTTVCDPCLPPRAGI